MSSYLRMHTRWLGLRISNSCKIHKISLKFSLRPAKATIVSICVNFKQHLNIIYSPLNYFTCHICLLYAPYRNINCNTIKDNLTELPLFNLQYSFCFIIFTRVRIKVDKIIDSISNDKYFWSIIFSNHPWQLKWTGGSKILTKPPLYITCSSFKNINIIKSAQVNLKDKFNIKSLPGHHSIFYGPSFKNDTIINVEQMKT